MRMRLALSVVAALTGTGLAHGGEYFDALTRAAINGDVRATSRLLKEGADPNSRNWQDLTPLSAAIRSCNVTVEIVETLMNAGADIEARSGVGATPLMVAWQMGRADIAAVLIAAGADQTATNLYGDTAKDYQAYYAGQLAPVEFVTLSYTSLGFVPRSAGRSSIHCDRQN